MAGKSFNLEIVTPKRVVFSGEAVSFSAPGVEGGFQVLVDHAPLLAGIGVGEVTVRDAQGSETRYATSGGVVQVRENRVTLMAESAERRDEIDAPRAASARDRAKQRLAERDAGLDVERARLALARALNRLNISSRN